MINRLWWANGFARLMHVYWRFSRGLTLGVRALVLDRDGRVFLVRHGYAEGWHLPGGGVEPGETMLDALKRELNEEGGIELTGTPALHATYFQPRYSNRDHVTLYVVRAFHQAAPPRPNREIAECGFFALGALPESTTMATRARLAEVLDGQPVPERW